SPTLPTLSAYPTLFRSSRPVDGPGAHLEARAAPSRKRSGAGGRRQWGGLQWRRVRWVRLTFTSTPIMATASTPSSPSLITSLSRSEEHTSELQSRETLV